ncbi:MAG TPA: molybdopterin cofactor-binding domain-containing protein [Steroidobacteraceae bacterium]
MPVSRRSFVVGAGAVLGGGFVYGYASLGLSSHVDRELARSIEGRDAFLLGAWLLLSRDDTVTVLIPHVDMGQGVHTALAMMTAEELDADWPKVKTIVAPAEDAYANWFLAESYTIDEGFIRNTGIADSIFKVVARRMDVQMTAGSTAVRCTGEFGLRRAGAGAREMLMRAAARRWSVPIESLSTQASRVRHEATGRELRYGELAEDAAKMRMPVRPKLKPRSRHWLVGRSVPRPDLVDKVTGAHKYAIDLRLPDMRYASTRASPVHGGKLIDVDPAPALAIEDVEHVVPMADSVGVIARTPWSAFKALAAVDPKFSAEDASRLTTQDLFGAQMQALGSAKREEKLRIGKGRAALRGASNIIEAFYRAPFLHHAQMEPSNAVALWHDGRLTLWTGTQNPLEARTLLAELAGIPFEAVTLHVLPLGGSFGRRADRDANAMLYGQAIALAKQASPHPVKLIWTREEDTAQGCYRPLVSTHISAAIGVDGLPFAWSQVYIEGRPGRSIPYPLPYSVPHQSWEEVAAPHHVRRGPFRSVNHTQHTFWRESFVDELAHAAKRDPLEYRVAMLGANARAREVIAALAERAEWSKPLPPGHGRGFALSTDYGSIIALAVEASWPGDHAKVHRAVAVVDCGEVIHPDCAAQQIEGGILMGLSSALDEEITIRDSQVVERSFTDYRIMRLAQTPEIDVHFMSSDATPGGLGEVGVPPAAPALANALFQATGMRARQTPLNKTLREMMKDRAAAGSELEA